MRSETPNERRRRLAQVYADQYSESFPKDLARMTEGWGEELRDELLEFFEEESNASYWLKLRAADERKRAQLTKAALMGDPEAAKALQTFRGEAESQLAQWQAARAMKRGTPESRGEAA